MNHKIDLITLGCSKNLVDSEHLMHQLESVGYTVTHDAERMTGDIAVVNTCGFIADAQEESINMILELAQRKNQGKLKKLYVMGCLSQRFMKELGEEIPEVDKYYGKFNWTELINELKSLSTSLSPKGERVTACNFERHLTTPGHYAYLKISEGCDRSCAYCAIPIITGRHQSSTIEEILDEVRYLVGKGVKEFQVIAQELTYYGLDIYKKRKIAELIDRMAEIPGVEWIRLHYAYPKDFPMDLLPVMRKHDNVCKYLDIALQHISNNVLDRMQRHITAKETTDLLETIRREVPGIHIRTTLMVGFPGETEQDFQQLCEFVKNARFDRMGAFSYSHEAGTPAAKNFEDNVPDEVKQTRLSKLMRIQQRISSDVQEAKVGQTLKVIIDRLEGEYYIGRTEFDSPEVDPEVLVKADFNPAISHGAGEIKIGNFYNVHIDSADDFDLYGTIVNN